MDPKKLTVEQLRELAKKHLKKGYSKLTRAELIAALQRVAEPAAKGGAAKPSRVSRLAEQAKSTANRVKDAARAKLEDQRAARATRKATEAKAPEGKAGTATARIASAAKRAAERAAEGATAAAKLLAARAAPGKAAKAATTKAASTKTAASAKVGAPKAAPAKVEAPKAAPAKVEAPKAAPAKVEAPKAAPAKAGAPKAAPAKVEAPKAAPAKVEAPKAAPAKVGARPRAESAKPPSTAAEPRSVVVPFAAVAAPEALSPTGAPVALPSAATSTPVSQRPEPLKIEERMTDREAKAGPAKSPKAPAATTPAAPAAPAPAAAEPAAPATAGAEPAAPATAAQAPAAAAAPPAPAPAAPAAPRTATPEPPIDSAAAAFAPPPAHYEPPEQIHFAEPLVEGFFVARIWGEGEARRHHLLEALSRSHPAPAEDLEGLGDLPVEPTHDVVVALPRDPSTLCVIWGLTRATIDASLDGVEEPRAVLRLYEDAGRPREFDIMLDMRGYYVHGLLPGESYRAEVLVYDRSGRSRRAGPSSNRVQLPRFGPSVNTEVRLMTVTPGAATEDAMRAARARVQRVEVPHFAYGRFDLPHSATLPGPGAPEGATRGRGRLPPTEWKGFWTPPRSGAGRGQK